MDITEMILAQHHEQRRMFALLDELGRADSDALAAVWKRLRVLLEVHAEAEERYFYPRLLSVGQGGAGESVDSETKDAIKDHNDIRDAIAKTDDQPVGTDAWWQAVTEARIANSDHMAEEERNDLADFRRRADLDTRHLIAVEFVTFESQHADGIVSQDKDAQAYVETTAEPVPAGPSDGRSETPSPGLDEARQPTQDSGTVVGGGLA